VEESSVQKRQFWSLRERIHINTEIGRKGVRDEEYIDELTMRLKNSVKLRLMSDVPLGVLLSGGVDSSLITAFMSELTDKPVKTFSVGFEDGDAHLNELKYSRLISKIFRTDHHEFLQTSDIRTLLPKIITQMDEPFANPTAIPMYHISNLARKHVKVALSGVGGDELFGGYPRHLALKFVRYLRVAPENVRKACAAVIAKSEKSPNPYSLFDRARRFISMESGSEAFIYEGFRSIFTEKQKDQIYAGWTNAELKGESNRNFGLLEEIFRGANGSNSIDKALFTDMMTYLPSDLLAYCDRMSMAQSLEIRVPFCDHEFVEFAMSIPAKVKIKRIQLKYLLKKVAGNILPYVVIYRKKQGFSVPVGYWLKKDLKGMVDEYLSQDLLQTHGYFNYKAIRQMIEMHQTGKANYSSQIWALLIFQIWNQLYMA
jgi:asparagine synthase (glutamine-hydrolysing)